MAVATNRDLAELDRRYHLHPFTSLRAHRDGMPTVITRGEGCRLWDSDGREYLDGLAGLWCVNVGYGREEIAEAIRAQATTLPYYHAFASMASEAPARLAERVVTMAPPQFSKVFYGNSGSDANDTAVKLVWYHNNILGRPKKKKDPGKIARLSRRDGGGRQLDRARGSPCGLRPAGLRGAEALGAASLLVADSGISEEEFARDLAQELEQVIEREGADTIGAMIAEPVMGAGGVFVPPKGYFDLIQPILKANDILLIVDEVINGFGRLGTTFGSESFAINADIMTIARA